MGCTSTGALTVTRYRVTVTNDCLAPRFKPTAGGFLCKSREQAMREAARWNAHIAPYNKAMHQNVQYHLDASR